jgi:hypothetical protein
VTEVVFTDLDGDYFFIVEDVQATVDNWGWNVEVSNDNGSTWIGSDIARISRSYWSDASSSAGGSVGSNRIIFTNQGSTRALGTANNEYGASTMFTVLHCGDTSFPCEVYGSKIGQGYVDGSTYYSLFGGSTSNPTNTTPPKGIDALKLGFVVLSSGTASGRIWHYRAGR